MSRNDWIDEAEPNNGYQFKFSLGETEEGTWNRQERTTVSVRWRKERTTASFR